MLSVGSRYPYLCVLFVSLHVNLYECKQSHVSNVIDVRMASICKISGNLITVLLSGKTIENTYNGIIPKIPCFKFYTSTYQIALKL